MRKVHLELLAEVVGVQHTLGGRLRIGRPLPVSPELGWLGRHCTRLAYVRERPVFFEEVGRVTMQRLRQRRECVSAHEGARVVALHRAPAISHHPSTKRGPTTPYCRPKAQHTAHQLLRANRRDDAPVHVSDGDRGEARLLCSRPGGVVQPINHPLILHPLHCVLLSRGHTAAGRCDGGWWEHRNRYRWRGLRWGGRREYLRRLERDLGPPRHGPASANAPGRKWCAELKTKSWDTNGGGASLARSTQSVYRYAHPPSL